MMRTIRKNPASAKAGRSHRFGTPIIRRPAGPPGRRSRVHMNRDDPDLTARLYRSLLQVRRVEEEIARIYPTDKIKSPVHLSIGQEAIAVGVCDALELSDIAFGTYRGHALYLAKGGDLRAM